MKKILYLLIGLALGFALGSPAAQAIEGILAQRCTSLFSSTVLPLRLKRTPSMDTTISSSATSVRRLALMFIGLPRTERYKSKRVNRTPARHPLEPEMSSRIYSQDQTLPLLMWTL